MDITGDIEGAYFGVLIRSLCRVSDGEVLCGPSVCLSAMLSQFGFTQVKDFVKVNPEILDADVYVANKFIYLR
jgi:hypothetical protein